jgi:hypothetical protein
VDLPRTIREFVDAVSSADGERAGLLVTEDATFNEEAVAAASE